MGKYCRPSRAFNGQGLFGWLDKETASIFNICSQQPTKQSLLGTTRPYLHHSTHRSGRQQQTFIALGREGLNSFKYFPFSGQSSRSPPLRPGLQTTQSSRSGLFRTGIPGWTGNYGKHRRCENSLAIYAFVRINKLLQPLPKRNP